MSLRVNLQSVNSPMKPLGVNNGATPIAVKTVKVTARADSTGLENLVGGGGAIIKHHHSVKKMQTPSVARRNARERNRVKVVNSGFDVLKTHVPNLKNKTSKVETLRAAVEYIKTLKEILGHEEDEDYVTSGPILIDDDDSNFSDLNDSAFSSSADSSHLLGGPGGGGPNDLSDLALHPMVYQLPPASAIPLYHSPPPPHLSSPPTSACLPAVSTPTDMKPLFLPSLSSSSSSSSSPLPSITSSPSLSSPLSPSSKASSSPPVVVARLPSIAAPAWWPESVNPSCTESS